MYKRQVGEALERLSKPDGFALLLLDVTLPDGTGFSVCEQVREKGSTVPIIFLTASDEEVNVIRGLDSGGDDYITKPFKLGELLSRIRALLRRAGISAAQPANQMPVSYTHLAFSRPWSLSVIYKTSIPMLSRHSRQRSSADSIRRPVST